MTAKRAVVKQFLGDILLMRGLPVDHVKLFTYLFFYF